MYTREIMIAETVTGHTVIAALTILLQRVPNFQKEIKSS
jgi:hypothetical protein